MGPPWCLYIHEISDEDVVFADLRSDWEHTNSFLSVHHQSRLSQQLRLQLFHTVNFFVCWFHLPFNFLEQWRHNNLLWDNKLFPKKWNFCHFFESNVYQLSSSLSLNSSSGLLLVSPQIFTALTTLACSRGVSRNLVSLYFPSILPSRSHW